MKRKILQTLFLCPFILSIANTSFAQIKVGTNPTTIESNSNFEVEATTSGRKIKIDKVTGQLTIADGSQEANEVLITDADGKASWQKIQSWNMATSSKAFFSGATTNVLENEVPQILYYPNLSGLYGNWHLDEFGLQVLEEGYYRIETNLRIENSAGCTGSSLMGLSVNLVYNGSILNEFGTDDRLTPVFQDSYKYNVALYSSLGFGSRITFSVKASIKSPQPGCTTKVVSGGLVLALQR